jgi:hypothetical protein
MAAARQWPPTLDSWLMERNPPQSCPSIDRGMPLEDVEGVTAKCADFIQKAGNELRLPQVTIATAMIFFHRHYTVQPFQGSDHFMVACAATFLAGKVEDTPKKLKDTILVMHKLQLKATGQTDRAWPPKKPDADPEYMKIKEQVVKAELELMKTLNFDLNVEHVYKFVIQYAKMVGGERDLAQVAWNFSNDSLRTRLCVQFRAKALAAGAIFLAAKFLKPKYDALFDDQFPAMFQDARTNSAEMEGRCVPSYTASSYLLHERYAVCELWACASGDMCEPWGASDIANQILDLYERGAAAVTGGPGLDDGAPNETGATGAR